MSRTPLTRRRFLQGALAATGAAGAAVWPDRLAAAPPSPAGLLTRAISSSGETIPLVGLGTWITFNVGADVAARDACAEVMRAFFDAGGRLIDSSPMYGSAAEVIGHGLAKVGRAKGLFAADKVWTGSGSEGPAQIEESRRAWGIAAFDLLQVHNLLAWEAHLETLQAMKAAGRLRYVGVTTSHGRRHGDLENILRRHALDFVQLTYNPVDREVEERLLPLARERGVAVIANRPFRQGELIRAVERHPLPAWAGEIDAVNWAHLLLKFTISHPAVTCAIPATSRVDHVRENLGASRGRLPDEALRQRIASHVRSL